VPSIPQCTTHAQATALLTPASRRDGPTVAPVAPTLTVTTYTIVYVLIHAWNPLTLTSNPSINHRHHRGLCLRYIILWWL